MALPKIFHTLLSTLIQLVGVVAPCERERGIFQNLYRKSRKFNSAQDVSPVKLARNLENESWRTVERCEIGFGQLICENWESLISALNSKRRQIRQRYKNLTRDLITAPSIGVLISTVFRNA